LAFDLAVRLPIALRIHDGEGRAIRTLVSGRQDAGRHNVIWDGRDDQGGDPVGGSGVYEIRFTLWTPDSSRIVYQDTVFAARYQPHWRPLGYTDQRGVFVSTDKALFPSVGDYPPLNVRDDAGRVIEPGFFAFDDTLIIAAVDTAANEVREYKRILSGSTNRFELVW
jgi:hypothetical protein